MTDNKWYLSTGNEADTVISTRIRLARNIAGIPFPSRMSAQQLSEVNRLVKNAIFSDPSAKDEYTYVEMDSLNSVTVAAMVERHLISPEFARMTDGHALILSKDESVSIMICEEDHIRIQVMCAGLDLKGAYERADKIDQLLGSHINFAFNERLGYLTECPTNLGTGLRASLMLHLPALEACNAIDRLAATVDKIGLTIRGTYGEGSKALASMYQLSNQVTLGISEQTAIDNLAAIAMQTMSQERAARESLDRDALDDAIYRSLGLLKYARSMSGSEFMELISKVRLGIATGLIKEYSLATVMQLIIECGAGAVQEAARREMEPMERDRKRAEIIRTRLAS